MIVKFTSFASLSPIKLLHLCCFISLIDMTALVSYDSSSDDEPGSDLKQDFNFLKHDLNQDDVSDTVKAKKLCVSVTESDRAKEKDNPLVHNQNYSRPENKNLPVPDAVKSMFTSIEHNPQDKPDLHQGRIRTFAHERGNWSSFVYIPFADQEAIAELREDLSAVLQPNITMYATEDVHISLSRTFVLRHHWIDTLLETLTTRMKICQKCSCNISEMELYCNDEGTRTFLGLKVGIGVENLKRYVKEIDSALKEFKLPEYYEDPSFHISIAWAHGDIRQSISTAIRKQLQDIINDFFDTYPNYSVINVTYLLFKTGNKVYRLPFS